jgi:hypothetical protein
MSTTTTVSLVAVALATPPTRQSMAGGYAKGSDEGFTRWRTSNAVGVLNQAILQLQAVIGLQTTANTEVTGLLALTDGNLSFGDFATGHPKDNLNTDLIGGTTPTSANTPFTLTHTLGQIPNGFVAGQKSVKSDFYGIATTQAWTNTTITILCDTASVDFVILVY